MWMKSDIFLLILSKPFLLPQKIPQFKEGLCLLTSPPLIALF